MFELLHDSDIEDQAAPFEALDAAAPESQETYHRISHFFKPDMLVSTYGLVDYWVQEICMYQRRKKSLNLGHSDIRGKDDLNAYHKYLTKYAQLNLHPVEGSYKRLQDLRFVRNQFVHHGGHIRDDKGVKEKISRIGGISQVGSLLEIEDGFVWDTLACAKTYLCAAAQQ